MQALQRNPKFQGRKGPVVLAIMDGVGIGKYKEGDAQAELQDQNVYRHQRKRCPDSSLDSAYRYFADKVSEVFIEGQVAFLHAGDISEVESFRLSGFTAMVGSTIYQTTGAGFISTRVRFLGQLIYNKGGLLLV